MKRYAALLLALSFALSLAGCRPPAAIPDIPLKERDYDAVYALVLDDVYRYPVVNLNYPFAEEINAQVQARYREQRAAIIQDRAGDIAVDFEHTFHDNVLSLIFCRISDRGDYEYQAWQMNIKSGRAVTNRGLLSFAGIDEAEFIDSLRRKVLYFHGGEIFYEIDVESLGLYYDEHKRMFAVMEFGYGERIIDYALPDEVYARGRGADEGWDVLN